MYRPCLKNWPSKWGKGTKESEKHHFYSFFRTAKSVMAKHMKDKEELKTPEGESYYMLFVLYIYLF